jgi:hypothetical protein
MVGQCIQAGEGRSQARKVDWLGSSAKLKRELKSEQQHCVGS